MATLALLRHAIVRRCVCTLGGSLCVALGAPACMDPAPVGHAPASESPALRDAVDAPSVASSSADAAEPAASSNCIAAPPGPCETLWWSDGGRAPLVTRFRYEGEHLVEERDGVPDRATVRRYFYDAAGWLVREEDQIPGEELFTVRYRRDAHGNVLEQRDAPVEGHERIERHVLRLDAQGRVARDDLFARPDGDIRGHHFWELPVQRLNWTLYDRDGRGDVRVEVEENDAGPYETRRFDRDEHGNITRIRRTSPEGRVSEQRYRSTYDPCGNRTAVEELRANGTVRDRLEYRYVCAEDATSEGARGE